MRHPPRGVAASGFPPLCNIPHCCLPQESGPCLSTSVADHPLKPATRHRLGELLPHQLADRIQADPAAESISQPLLKEEGVSSINHRFQWLSRSAGHITYILLTRAPLVSIEASFYLLPFDLHVLSTPPAFTLSQDQTLRNYTKRSFVNELLTFAQDLKIIGLLKKHFSYAKSGSLVLFATNRVNSQWTCMYLFYWDPIN